MKKTLATIGLLSLLLTSCGGDKYVASLQAYELLPSDDSTGWPVIKMNSVLSENLYFKMRYDPKAWELVDSNGDYVTNFYFRDINYKGDSCIVLPGTKGYKLDKEYTVSQWAYKSDRTSGIDYEFKNPVTGIIEMRVFETASNGQGLPSALFELHLPTDGQDQEQCYTDYQQIIGTYSFDHYDGTPEELKAILQNLEEIKKQNAEIEKQKELEQAVQNSNTTTGTGEAI